LLTGSGLAVPRTIKETKLDGSILRLVQKDKAFIGIILADGGIKIQIDGTSADDVWRRLHDEAAKANPKYAGFDGARNRFLYWFQGGFYSVNYLANERSYKAKAKSDLESKAPLESAATGSGFGNAIWSVFQTNLLSPFEKMRVRDVLRGPTADAFIQAAARFTLGEGKPALLDMERALKPHDSAKWTAVTYLPFLWRPEQHMFLKPEATKDFAERVGHRFARDYEPRLNIAVYDSLLDLAVKTMDELEDLKPRDRIDVQSFIWVVGDYKDGREIPPP
jgi:hypothetical protein